MYKSVVVTIWLGRIALPAAATKALLARRINVRNCHLLGSHGQKVFDGLLDGLSHDVRIASHQRSVDGADDLSVLDDVGKRVFKVLELADAQLPADQIERVIAHGIGAALFAVYLPLILGKGFGICATGVHDQNPAPLPSQGTAT